MNNEDIVAELQTLNASVAKMARFLELCQEFFMAAVEKELNSDDAKKTETLRAFFDAVRKGK